MTPYLLCMFGPLKGDRIALTKESVVIGRDRSSDIHISDLLLSRKHCMLQKTDDSYKILDLQSRNGISINGIPVHERNLNHGDIVKLGNSTFVFQTHEEQSSSADSPGPEFLHSKSTVTLSIEDSSLLKHPSTGLMVLIRVARTLSDATTLSAFYDGLLRLVFEMIPCDQASIIGVDLSRIETHSKEQSKKQRINKKICEEVIQQKVAILAGDFIEPQPQTDSRSNSVLAIPFLHAGQILNILYMDTIDPAKKLEENHLQIGSALSAIASPMLYQLQEIERIRSQNQELQQNAKGMMIGESPSITKVFQLIARIAPADTTVLIQGESGTGKELAAKAIHSASSRKNGPFIAINCAAIPEALLESELFGYEKGAFTGALNQKKGKIEIAHGGTLFLDEIGELAPIMQAKLLRVLQERQFERLGGIRWIPVDIRVIAATNQDLEKLISEGKFRQDLFYRLNVVNLKMPPLRDLGDDIVLLSQYFISQFAQKIGRRVLGLSNEAKECMLRYDWPGNIRELQNAIERAVALGTSEWIQWDDLPESLMEIYSPSSNIDADTYQATLVRVKKEIVLKAFKGTDGNYNEAAARLGIQPNHLYRLVKNLKLKDQI
jgi:two-component system, NtrC family, response regulator HydG